jgi:rod shape-determining protein MreC
VGGLVLLSLVLITLSFRSTALDGAQGTAADVLRPFEIAADRVTRPFRDAAGYARGLFDAKSENEALRRQIAELRRQHVLDESALQQNVQLRAALDFRGPPSIADFRQVHTEVLTNAQSAIDQSVTIAAGSSSGVAAGDVVVAPTGGGAGGLVGVVDRVWSGVARVTLLTDEQSSVTAMDLTSPTAVGVIQRSGGSDDVLDLNQVSKTKPINVGDTIITAGTLGKGALPSMFPANILVGTVTSQSIGDVNPFQNIQVKPFVDFSSLQSVIVLVPRH